MGRGRVRRDVWWGLYLTSLLGAGDLGESMGGGHDGTETIVRHQGPLGEAPGLPCRNRGRRGPLGGTGRLLPDRSLVLRQGALGSRISPGGGGPGLCSMSTQEKVGWNWRNWGRTGQRPHSDVQSPFPLLQLPRRGPPLLSSHIQQDVQGGRL